MDDLSTKWYLFLNLLLALGMALSAMTAFPEASQGSFSTLNFFLGIFLVAIFFFNALPILASLKDERARLFVCLRYGITLSAAVPYILALCINNLDTKRILMWTGMSMDIFLNTTISGIVVFIDNRLNGNGSYRVGLNIEHFAERFGLLTIVFMGLFYYMC